MLFLIITQQELTTPDCLNNINIESDFEGLVKSIELGGYGWNYNILDSVIIKVYILDEIGDSSYVDIPACFEGIRFFKVTLDQFLGI